MRPNPAGRASSRPASIATLGYFREVCYNELARRMRAAGYELEPVRRIGFAVKGVPA